MASRTKDWTEEEERWAFGIENVISASTKDLTDYLLFKLWQYEDNKLMDYALWEFYKEDFQYFDPGIFGRINGMQLRKMYEYLRAGGVYIQAKKYRMTYAQLLDEVLHEEEPHTWTMAEIQEVQEDMKDSNFASNRINNILRRGYIRSAPTTPASRPQTVPQPIRSEPTHEYPPIPPRNEPVRGYPPLPPYPALEPPLPPLPVQGYQPAEPQMTSARPARTQYLQHQQP